MFTAGINDKVTKELLTHHVLDLLEQSMCNLPVTTSVNTQFMYEVQTCLRSLQHASDQRTISDLQRTVLFSECRMDALRAADCS